MKIKQWAEELLPCPFCGGARVTVWNIRDGQQAVCKDCKSTGAPAFNGAHGPEETWQRAVTAWNRRVTHPAPNPAKDVRGYLEQALAAINALPRSVIETANNNGDVFVSLRRVRAVLSCLTPHQEPAGEAAEKRIAELEAALKPFAQKMDWPLSERDAGRKVFCQLTGNGSGASFGLDADDFIRARAALSTNSEGK